MARYIFGPMLMGAIGFLFGLQVAEGWLGCERVVALVPSAFCGLVFGIACLICEYRRRPDRRDQQDVYVSNERCDE